MGGREMGTVGEMIAEELSQQGINYCSFAHWIGLTLTQLNDLLEGDYPIDRSLAEKIEEQLGIDVEEILSLTD